MIGQQQETSNPREEKKIYDSRQLKEAHQKLTEKYRVVQEQIDAQVRVSVRVLGRHKIKSGCGKVKIDFFRIGKHCWSLSEESGEASAHMTRIRGPLSSILAVRKVVLLRQV